MIGFTTAGACPENPSLNTRPLVMSLARVSPSGPPMTIRLIRPNGLFGSSRGGANIGLTGGPPRPTIWSIRSALHAGHGVDVKNLYNLYVYFWRWALWKVFEHSSTNGPGVVSYISASSYLDGDAFVGMREHMRRVCDEIWIIDLGGEGRGTRKSENVFAIQTPVAIAIAVCYRKNNWNKPAKVHFARIEGTRKEKLAKLDTITDFADLTWQRCPEDWHEHFRPSGAGNYFDWPLLIDLMPWQHSGMHVKRTWPIAPDIDTLKRRWQALLTADNRDEAFKETRDRKINHSYAQLSSTQKHHKPQKRHESIAALGGKAPMPRPCGLAYRSFDRQWLFLDNRLGDYLRPDLWRAYSEQQVYLTSLFSQPLGIGPAVTVAAQIPDLDHFRGSYGAKATIPLYRDAAGKFPNILPGLLDLLRAQMADLFEEYDLLLSPTLSRTALPVGVFPEEIAGKPAYPHRYFGFHPFTFPINAIGHAAASIPAGFSSDGLPIGLHIVGRKGGEETVIAASAAFERARPWIQHRPPVS